MGKLCEECGKEKERKEWVVCNKCSRKIANREVKKMLKEVFD